MEDTLRQFDALQHWQDIYPAPDAWSRTVKSITLPGTPLPEFSCTSYKGNGQFLLPPVQTQPPLVPFVGGKSGGD